MGEYSRHHYYTVDLNKPLQRHFCGLLLATNDDRGDEITFAMNRGGVPYMPEIMPTFSGYFVRPDGVTVRFDVQHLQLDSTVTLTLDKKCYEKEGRFVLSVQMRKSNEAETTIAIIDGFIRKVRNGKVVYPDADGEGDSSDGGDVSWATDVPDYWQSHIDARVNDTNIAMAAAAGNRSAFLFYTDAHWTHNHKKSPALMKYLCMNTPIKKVIFGGDIVHDEGDDMSYLDDWREAVSVLPCHHSVPGNHDDGNEIDNRWDDAYIYDFLLADEATDDVVKGDGLYYYIDDVAEKTRYLYLDTATKDGNILNDPVQEAWLKRTLLSTPSGWHIIAIGHIWRVYENVNGVDVDAGFSMGAEVCLDMFDAYNARTGDFASCTGKVEFCIGGHLHWDSDHVSDGGIPVLIITTDGRRVKNGETNTAGTITEASVSAIVADYAAGVVKVIRIGRGNSRTVNLTGGAIGGEDAWKTTAITRTLQTSDDTVAIEWRDNVNGVTYVVYDGNTEVARVTNHTQTVLFGVSAGNHTYKVRPQKSDSEVGEYSDGVSLTTVADVGFTNMLRIATDADGNPYNGGVGYVENLRISTNDFTEKSANGWDTTGYFPIERGQVVRLYNMQYYDIYDTGGTSKRQCIFGYSADRKSCTAAGNGELSSTWSPVLNGEGDVTQFTMVGSWSDDDYLRITAKNIDAFSIITVNEEANITE